MKLFLRQLTAVMLCAASIAAAYAQQPQRKARNVEKSAYALPLKTGSQRPVEAVKKTRVGGFRVDQPAVARQIEGSVKVAAPKPLKTRKAASDNMPAIYGCLEYSGTRGNFEHTVSKLPTSDDEQFEIVVEGVNAIDGGVAVGNTYFAAYHTEYYGEYQLYINGYDLTTGERVIQRYGDVSAEATDVAYNPVDGKVYGCFCDPDSHDYSEYYFGTIDYNTGVTTRISALPRQLAAIAINAAGKIYVIDKQQEKDGYSLYTVGADLYEISATTGEMTFIGKTGQLPLYRSSACIDPVSGRMFWTVSPADECGYLYEVDTRTGATELIYTFPGDEEIVGLYIPDTGVKSDSPSAVAGLEASFPGGDVKGEIKFTMPSTDVNGDAISGLLSWTLTANGEKIADGSNAAGENVAVPVTVDKEGLYKFAVIVENDNGPSPEASVEVFIGHDTPAVPVVDATIDGTSVNISWTAVTTSVNGGYIDPAAVTYRVMRQPDNVIIARSTSETSLTDELPVPEKLAVYNYTVEAISAGIISQPGQSPKLIAGSLDVPFTDDFNDIKSFDYYTVINANDDDNTWGPYIGNLRCSYNQDMAMDDWLITPPVMLEAGKGYSFSIDVLTGNANAPESFEVMWGTANTANAMVNTVIEKKSVAHTNYVNYRGFIVPEKTGVHYVGIHGCSDADMYTLTIDNLTFGAGADSRVPAIVTDLSPVSRTNGELKADITLKAPSTDLAGNRLESIDRVIVKRDGSPVKVFESPAPGATLSFVDEVPGCDNFIYSAVAVNSFGESSSTEVTTYVGVLEPANPSNVVMVETSTPGEVTISWDAPETDVKGNALDPQFVTYRIYVPVGSTMDVLEGGIKETSYTFRALENADKQQAFVQFVVVAETLGGISDGMPTGMIPIGKPYPAPYRESFANGAPWSILATNSTGGARWQLFDDDAEITAVDGDNCFIGSQASFIEDYGTLMLGKIDLTGVESPVLSFYTYSITGLDGELDENEIDVIAVVNGESTLVKTIKISDYSQEDGWVKIVLPLTGFTGKQVQLMFTSRAYSWVYTFIDNIRVENIVENNLTVNNIWAPETVKNNSEFEIITEIENNGEKEAKGYTVDLYLNGEKIASEEGMPLAVTERTTHVFVHSFSVFDSEPARFKVVVDYPADNFKSDNESDEITVTPVLPTLPTVTAVEGEAAESGITLKWSAPDPADYIPDPFTETFEKFESWSTEGAFGWTFVDRDGAQIGGFNDGTEFPGIPMGSVQSFFVFDNLTNGFNDYFNNAHSGNKFIAQMFSYKNQAEAQCDDWAISPELYGGAQTISFYARCYDPTYPETFEILYSTGSTNPDDFIAVATETATSDEWHIFNAELPEGARRFAIRCISDFKFMFFVDDVTYIPVAGENDIELKGYNIYRDGEFAGNVAADVTGFVDTDADLSVAHTYQVTAVYDRGESRPSEVLTVSALGVGIVDAGGVMIAGADGEIIVRNATGLDVTVASADGRVVAAVTSAADVERISAVPGLYIVSAGNTVAKVIVK